MTGVLGRGAVRAFVLFGVVLSVVATWYSLVVLGRQATKGSSGSEPGQLVVLTHVVGPTTGDVALLHGVAVLDETDGAIELVFSTDPLTCSGSVHQGLAAWRTRDDASYLFVHIAPGASIAVPVSATTRWDFFPPSSKPVSATLHVWKPVIDREGSKVILDELAPKRGGRVRGTVTLEVRYHDFEDGAAAAMRAGGRFDLPVCTYLGPRWLRRLGGWLDVK